MSKKNKIKKLKKELQSLGQLSADRWNMCLSVLDRRDAWRYLAEKQNEVLATWAGLNAVDSLSLDFSTLEDIDPKSKHLIVWAGISDSHSFFPVPEPVDPITYLVNKSVDKDS